MATKAVDLMTQKVCWVCVSAMEWCSWCNLAMGSHVTLVCMCQLLRPEDVFARLEPRRVARILGPTLESMMGQLIAELGQKQVILIIRACVLAA